MLVHTPVPDMAKSKATFKAIGFRVGFQFSLTCLRNELITQGIKEQT